MAQQATVNLGSASTFAALAGSTVTVTGAGTITGNVGVFPGSAYVAGNPPVTVLGTIYAGGPVAAQAIADLTTAFNDAAGRTVAPITVAGNIGGQTLAPGLYKSTSSLAISSGDLTLDAQGNANAVWIFQIASTLTTTSGRQVILAGGANPANIFWQVGSSATIGTTSVFQGNILAQISISMLTGSTLTGRALAIGGAVTIDTGGGTSAMLPVTINLPTVISTNPAAGAIGVLTNSQVTATFSTAMNPATISAATFTLKQGLTSVSGIVSYAGTTATFTPTVALLPLTTFTGTITNQATDLAGHALAANYVWTFTTGAAIDIIPPTVISTVPANAALAVLVSNRLSATFSKAMDPLTINASTFTLSRGGTPVLGVVTYSGTTATFAPFGNLNPGAVYTGTITTGSKDLSGNALVSNYVWSFTTNSDITPPTVLSSTPLSGSQSVTLGSVLTATFSKAMDPSTISSSTFTLQRGATLVTGTVTYVGTTATFAPSSSLTSATAYTATITTGSKDLAGNALVSNYVWNFTTGSPLDTTPPTVTSTSPLSGALAVTLGGSLTATFSKAMDPSTISTSTFTLQKGGTAVSGTVTYAGTSATFAPSISLTPSTAYTATITSGAKDLAGNALATNYVWNFTTGLPPDITPPTVISTSPTNTSLGAALGSVITATFSKAMNPSTISAATFTLQHGAVSVSGTVTYVGTVATLAPSIILTPSSLYTATITSGAKDLAGNALVSNYTWSFTTGLPPDTTPPAVISTTPLSNAQGVTLGSTLTATFSKAMDPTTISASTFTLQHGATLVSGTVTYAGATATFTPSVSLAAGTAYSATMTTAAKDMAGNALPAIYAWSFTTGSPADTTPPTVISTSPLNTSQGASLGSILTATFSKPLDPSTISTTTFTLLRGSTPVSGTVTYSGTTATFAPSSSLVSGAAYTATITTGAKDMAGNALANTYVWSFTVAVTNAILPTVTSTGPANSSLGVTLGSMVTATFSTPMDALTLTAGTFTLRQGLVSVAGTVTYSGATATFAPLVALISGTAYTATITSGAKDVAGDALAANYTWTFTTAAAVSTAPAITPGSTVNDASFVAPVVAGSIAAVFGSNLSIGQATSGSFNLLPKTLAQSSFVIGGQAAPLFFAMPTQVNLQIPWELAGQIQTTITATVNSVPSTTQIVSLAPFGPGIFSMDSSGTGQGAVLVAPTPQLAAAGTAVPRGGYIAIFCTGLGAVSDQPATGVAALSAPLSFTLTQPTVTIGGVPAQVTYSGLAPGFAGLYQVNALVPQGVTPGNTVTLVMSIGGAQSNTVTIAVQ